MKADFRERLLQCLGGEWPKPSPLNPKILQREKKDKYELIKVQYDVESKDPVKAYLLVPHSATKAKPAPGICLWHQHAGQWHLGKSEPAGLKGNEMHFTGAALAREGYVVLCPDAIGFEERETPYRQKGRNLERFLFLKYVVSGKCMAWKNILDMRRAVDFLVQQKEVKADAIGCYGHSMGSTHTWLVGPWEPRLKALVGNCCLPTYEAIHHHQMLHCFPNYVPGIFEHGDTPDIAALIAPRALHLNFGEKDGGSPIDFVRKGLTTIERAYESQHAEKNFSYFIEERAGHVLSASMWKKTKEFFRRHLNA